MTRTRRIWFAAALVCTALALAAALASAADTPSTTADTSSARVGSPAAVWSPDEIALAERGLDLDDRRLVEEFAGQTDLEDRSVVRIDLGRLADDWESSGGADGYPFWEHAWRRFQADDLAPSTLRDYTVAYRDLVRRGRDRVGGRDVDTDIGHEVRARLERALELRLAALDELVAYTQERTLHQSTSEELAGRIDRFEDQLQASYRQTRSALNLSQGALQESGLELIPDDAFL